MDAIHTGAVAQVRPSVRAGRAAERKIWQVSAGEDGRDYAELCLRWGVILASPAEDTRWERQAFLRFSEKVKSGDAVVLNRGNRHISAVGVVSGSYKSCPAFSDVDGLDLRHVRPVQWLWHAPIPKRFAGYPLHSAGAISEMRNTAIRRWLDRLDLHAKPSRPIAMPAEGAPTSLGAIAAHLAHSGMHEEFIGRTLKAIAATRIRAYGYRQESRPSELDTLGQLVLPLFHSLGWPAQFIAVEWNNIDVALFQSLPKSDKTLGAIVEVKRLGSAILTAAPQAQRYANGRPNCRKLIVTDGLRYGIYLRDRGDFALHAYLNLARMRDSYPIYPGQVLAPAKPALPPSLAVAHGSKEALTALSPIGKGL